MSYNRRALPFEERDQTDRAEAWYNNPLRAEIRTLTEEIQRLKKLHSGHNNSGPSGAAFEEAQSSPSVARIKRMTRSSTSKVSLEREPRMPSLPVEIQLKILSYSLISSFPIIDPLSKHTKESMTAEERARGNQIAIGFLATCKAYHTEGLRYLWGRNEFVFTSHYALRNFANLSLEHRKVVKFINIRIIAKYYDDARRVRTAKSNVPGRKITIKTAARLHENPLARKGYKSYTWLQLIDFLDALRPPFDPRYKSKKAPRPRLLPGLESMRIDFVNFPREYLAMPDIDLHRIAVHDLGCTLNELVLTGLPEDDCGIRALSDLNGMVRDDGLLMKAFDSFMSDSTVLTRVRDCPFDARVVRSWKPLDHDHIHHHPDISPAPVDVGHPESIYKEKKTIWRRVPKSRDASRDDRTWVEFSRTLGTPVEPDKPDVDESSLLFCDECGEVHEPMLDHHI
ncbi:hypothetical protein B0T16DRAFT_391791 [Cercophora newfieldiana]|uniref:F-box domain-containing protein n=1 Tax=Cercophora newfieldiana TaxID=92897 RepID=A0AA40CNB7_9PEZI|nr:hypothetical protein B0T16DRAFT_391791 [Cercophora newfieldiana]